MRRHKSSGVTPPVTDDRLVRKGGGWGECSVNRRQSLGCPGRACCLLLQPPCAGRADLASEASAAQRFRVDRCAAGKTVPE